MTDLPAGRDDGEVDDRRAGLSVRGRSQNRVQAGVVFVEEQVAQDAEAREVVFVGVEGAVPGGDVEGGVGLRAGPETACLAGDDFPVGVVVGEGSAGVGDVAVQAGGGDLEVADVGEAGAADRTELRQAEVRLEEFADVASTCLAGRKSHAVANAARNDADLVLSDEELAEFGVDVKSAGLGDDEGVAIEGRECCVGFHVLGDAEEPYGQAGLGGWIAVAG